MRASAESTSDSEDILFDLQDGIARVTFNRPQSRNAFTFAMYERLAEICRELDRTGSARAMILTGAGDKAFAAGTDISQFRSFSTPEDAIGYEERGGAVISVLEQCRVPTIAAIAGACTGGGAAIAAACDLRIAAGNAKFGLPIARTLGNCLSMDAYARFAALIGPARLKEIIFTARLVEADEAKAIGLVHEVVPDVAELLPRAEAVARLVASHAPLTLRATKEALHRLRPKVEPGADRDIILSCYMSEDFREGMDAFLTKRQPQWRGR